MMTQVVEEAEAERRLREWPVAHEVGAERRLQEWRVQVRATGVVGG